MLENFSKVALNILNTMKIMSSTKTLGSEYLLSAMYNIEDSLCRFLFNEYNVDIKELEEELEKIEILRHDELVYTKELEKIFSYALELSSDNLVSDEHLFMAILNNKDSIAYDILIRLGFDINELINDVNEIYEFKDSLSDIPYLYNMTNNNTYNYVGISNYIEQIMVILKRKNKNNPILIGNAGVGKSAIVEGLASYIKDNNLGLEIVSLNIGSMLSGTKYRGDFEERLDNVVKAIIKKKNVIVFIDEIHTIVGSGSSESALDISNMLKPYLARNDFKVIGATTINEYNKYILKDKALQRRFEKVFVKEPSVIDTKKIMYGIIDDYEKYHNVLVKKDILDYIVNICDKRIITKKRPDKCIDILDSMMSYLSLKNIKEARMSDVDETINRILGYKENDEDIYFKSLLKYYFMYENNMNDKIIMKLRYGGNKEGYDILINDLKKLYGIEDEMILDLNLELINNNSLIGNYSNDGILIEHLKSYPTSVISLSNYHDSYYEISNIFNDMVDKGYILDSNLNHISTKNVILIYQNIIDSSNIGFNSKSLDSNSFDLIITYDKKTKFYNDNYIKTLKKYNIEASIMFDIDDNNKKIVNDMVYEIVENKRTGDITIYEENGIIKYR